MRDSDNTKDDCDEMSESRTPGQAIDDALRAIVSIDNRLKTIESDIKEIKGHEKPATVSDIERIFNTHVNTLNKGFKSHRSSHDIGLINKFTTFIRRR